MNLLATPLHLLRSLTANATLPVYELQRDHVSAKATRIRPFDPNRGFTGDPLCPIDATSTPTLSLTGWRLAHAVKKADCLRQLHFPIVARIGFLLEHLPTFDWRPSNLRLFAGVAAAYADFVGTGFAGRVGQGLALLAMEKRGYLYAAHYPRPPTEEGPDFIVQERKTQARALVEAKGAFVVPDDQPNIKGILREALGQLAASKPQGASKSFAVASFLREVGDRHEEPSLIALVDPDRSENGEGDFPGDRIVRLNYAGWLDAMGLHTAASDLRSGVRSEVRPEIRLHGLRVQGTDFRVAALQWMFPEDEYRWMDHPRPYWHGRCLVAGLPRTVVRSLVATVRDPQTPVVGDSDIGGDDKAHAAGSFNGAFKGSILGDGSLLGMVDADHLEPIEEVTG